MFKRLFGETEEIQLQYLKNRVIFTVIAVIIEILAVLSELIGISTLTDILGLVGSVLLLIMMFLWGFGAMKTLFGFGTIGAFFARNVVFGVVIFGFCFIASYFISIFVALLGVGRYIYLKVQLLQRKE